MGESYENVFCLVPTIRLTVTSNGIAVPYPAEALHTREVPVSQDVEAHRVSSNMAVTVRSLDPNDNPVKVRSPPPLVGLLTGEEDVGTGASNENPLSLVPTTAAMVTIAESLGPPPAAAAHFTCVSETQTVLEHAAEEMRAVALGLVVAKFCPSIVTVYPVAEGPLGVSRLVTIGASNVNRFNSVPTMAPTVTRSAFLEPVPFGTTQFTAESEIQFNVPQLVMPSFPLLVKSDLPKLKP